MKGVSLWYVRTVVTSEMLFSTCSDCVEFWKYADDPPIMIEHGFKYAQYAAIELFDTVQFGMSERL